MPTPTEVVNDFMTAWSSGRDAFVESWQHYLHPEVVYENVGLTLTQGRNAAVALIDDLVPKFDYIDVDVLHEAANGNMVLNERLDHLMDADGKLVLTVRLMDVFRVEQGKIIEWRDYLDTAAIRDMTQ